MGYYLQHLTLTQTIKKIEVLIDTNNGDTGRLCHILEFLKKRRPLYRSDQAYLENKLNSFFSAVEEEKEPVQDNNLLPIVEQLINSGKGDLGRLRYIYEMLANNRPLYRSDQMYLKSKLQPSTQEQTIEVGLSKSEPANKHIISSSQKISKKPEPPQELSLVSKPEPEPKIKGGLLPKGWSSETNSKELTTLSEHIQEEQQKIQQQKNISDEITLQRSKLKELISHRKEYEQKVIQDKSSLESQIKDERLKIEIQTKLSEEITAQQQELIKVKKEREIIIKNINSEKTQTSQELAKQKKELIEAQLEQEKIEKQVQNEQILLSKMVEEQKSSLIEQAKIAHKIKLHQAEIEKTRKDYDEILSQINEEKTKFAETEKLQKRIKTQEQNLANIKQKRLSLINAFSKEKELMLKKAEEEKEKLKSQTELTKQLKKDEKVIESLKKKREKIEQQIKTKNQKLKQQQQKLKKQIVEKNNKLKSLAQRNPKQKILKI